MKKTICSTLFLVVALLAMPTMALATNGGGGSDSIIGVVGSIVIGLVVACLVTGVMRGQLKSVKFQDSASFYVSQGSLNVTKSRDLYLGSQVVSRPIAHPDTDNDN